MNVRTYLAFSRVPFNNHDLVVVDRTPATWYGGRQADLILWDCLNRPQDLRDVIEGRVEAMGDVVYDDYERPKSFSPDALDRIRQVTSGKVVLVGVDTSQLDSLGGFCWLRLDYDYGEVSRAIEKRYEQIWRANPGDFDNEVYKEIFPILPGITWETFRRVLEDCHDFDSLARLLKAQPKLPAPAFGFYQAYLPSLMGLAGSTDKIRETVAALLPEPVGFKLRHRKRDEVVFLSLPETDETTAELASCWLIGYDAGDVVEVHLERLGEPAALDFKRNAFLRSLLRGVASYHLDDPVVVWLTGAKSREEVDEVVKNLSVAFKVAVVFYNPVQEKQEKGGKVIGNSIVESWRRSGEELSYKIWKPVLAVGILWLGLSFLLNIIGMAPAFVGDNFFVAVGRMIKEADPGTYFNVIVASVMGFCMASAITALEIFGRTRMKDPFILLLLVIAYVSGLALNYAGIQGSYEAAAKAGSASNELAGFVRLIAAVATEFLPEQMIILAMEVGARDRGTLDGMIKPADEIPVRIRGNVSNLSEPIAAETGGNGQGAVKIVRWTEFKESQECCGLDCDKLTKIAVVTKIDGDSINFAVCGRCMLKVKKDPSILTGWDGL